MKLLVLIFISIFFLCLPGLNASAAGLGAVTGAVVQGDTVTISVGRDQLILEALQSDILRVDFRPGGHTSSRTLVLDPNATWETGNIKSVNLTSNPMVIQTASMLVSISKSPCRISIYDATGQNLILKEQDATGVYNTGINFNHNPGDNFYGMSGYKSDQDSSPGMLRNSGGLVTALSQGWAGGPFIFTPYYGLLVDSDGGNFVINSNELNYTGVSRSDVEYFVLTGPPKEVMQSVAQLSGHPPLYPKSSLGFMDCERGDTEAQLTTIARTYREKSIPIDMIVMDIDWKAWGEDDFGEWRWNSTSGPGNIGPDKFPHGASGLFAASMAKLGVKLGGIMKPRILLTNLDGTPTMAAQEATANDYWFAKKKPFRDYFTGRQSQDLDFSNPATRDWYWSNSQKSYDTGIAAWWNDEADDRNNFQFLNFERTLYEGQRGHTDNRVWSINRNFYLGSQRYAYGLWSGDSYTGFSNMASQRSRMLSSINSGEAKWGMDIGGYGGRATSENYARWMQFGAFTPIFRMHCDATAATQPQPWDFGNQAEALAKSVIQLRYKLLPYIYSNERKNYETGLGIVEPLFYEFPEDDNLINYSDAWMFGNSLLAAPVVDQGQTVKSIYLAAGTWYDYFRGTAYRGGQYINYTVNPSTWADIPLFIRQGAIIPTQEVLNYVGEKAVTTVNVDVFPDTTPTSFTYYDDDGTTYAYEGGDYFKQEMTASENPKNATFSIGAKTGSFTPPLANYICAIHRRTATAVSINKAAVPEYDSLAKLTAATGEGWAAASDIYGSVIYVKLPAGVSENIVVTGNGTVNPSNKYEAEAAALSGHAVVKTDHLNYSGTGFVGGYQHQGATTTFTVNVPQAGNYDVALAYGNANGVAESLSVYVNGIKTDRTLLPPLPNWDTWGLQAETLSLQQGSNTIAYKNDPGDGGDVNLDYIILTPSNKYEAELAALTKPAVIETNHVGYSGTGFVAGYTAVGATTNFTVNAAQTGSYSVSLAYGNATGRTKTISIYVNGVKIKQTSLSSLATWDMWGSQTEILSLNAGRNSIAYKYDHGDSGNVNLDDITLSPN